MIERGKTEGIYQEMLLMTVSHEMKNPLNGKSLYMLILLVAIIQAIELLSTYMNHRTEGYHCVKIIKNSSRLLLFLMNDMLV